MALDDFLESEVAIAAAVTAAAFSPRVRGIVRRGAVLGLAGVLIAGDALGSFVRGVGRGAQQAAGTAATTAEDAADALAATARRATEKASDVTSEVETPAPSATERRSRRTRDTAAAEGTANE